MNREEGYVDCFYRKFEGRVPIGVAYHQDITAIYPLVFENSKGEAIGAVAIVALHDEEGSVRIYHLAAFISKCGRSKAKNSLDGTNDSASGVMPCCGATPNNGHFTGNHRRSG